MTIYFAADHAGFTLKNELLGYVANDLGYEVEDCGAYEYDEGDDYPAFIRKAAEAVGEDPKGRKAIVLGGSGSGEAIAANKLPGVRAALYYGGNLDIVRLSREHNDANVLSLGARFISLGDAKEAVKLWLSTDFTGEERHVRRIAAIEPG